MSIAVDQGGALYGVDQSANLSFAPARVYKFTFPGPGEVSAKEFASEYLTQTTGDGSTIDPTDIAIDPVSQHVLVAKKEGFGATKFYEFDGSGTLLDKSPASEAGLEARADAGLAVGTGGRFYFSNGRLGLIDILGPPPAPTVSIAAATGVDVDSAILHGTVTPPQPVEGTGFDTTYHFEYSLDGIKWSSFPAEDVDIGDGSGFGPPNTCPVNNPPSCAVEQTVTGLVPNSHYLVRLTASTGTGAVSGTESLTTEPGKPLVSGTAAEEIVESSVKLTGTVNPVNEATTYHFEWGTDTSYGNRVPVETEGSAGSGGQSVAVSALLEGLRAGTIYHFRLLATNSSGTTEGPDREFSTLDRHGLPDARVPEQVSPNDKRPVGMVAQILEHNIKFQASTDGERIIYPLLNGSVDATAGGNVDYVGTRGESGWQSAQVTPPSLVPAVHEGGETDQTGNVLYASADLSCEIVESFEPLTADTPVEDVAHGINNLYRRSADGAYTLLSTSVPLAAPTATYKVDWTSADCSHVLFETSARLLEEAPIGTSTLYEWAGGALRIAGVRPDEGVAGGESVAGDAIASLGSSGLGSIGTTWNSMSSDGSKVFFSAISHAGGDKGHLAVFMRENGMSTVDVSQSQTATAGGNAYYSMATPDGSHVFFFADYGLARNGTSSGASVCSNEGGAGCDLYDYDTSTKILTDISIDTSPADVKGASVIGLFDASDDGSYVYFAARGQLVAGQGKSEPQNLRGDGTYNVYLMHNGTLAYIGLIAAADAEEGSASGVDVSYVFNKWTADATPDGEHLLFVSKANVTGYSSEGVTEAYVYSAASGETVCVSCRTDGLPSLGDAKTEPIAIDPIGTGAAAANEVLSRRRSISDDGRRVFFSMPDVLVAGAKAHTHNIYEWEAGQVYLVVSGEEGGSDLTEYAGASGSGNDVFVVTKTKLVSQDFDSTPDIYDLRTGGGFVEPEPVRPPCDSLADKCQGEATPPLFEPPGPASKAFGGIGNPASAVVRCGKDLALVRGKCVRKKRMVKHKKRVVKRCGKGHVRKHGKCVRKASVFRRARAVANNGRVAR